MPNSLQSYNPHKIKLLFRGFDLKVEELDRSIALNQYANSSFTSFSIDSPEFEDKKGVFVFTVNGTVVYVGMTNDSLKNVIIGTYGNIIPRKLHKDGQLTACRLSAFLNKITIKKLNYGLLNAMIKKRLSKLKMNWLMNISQR